MGFVLKSKFQINPLKNSYDYEREISRLIFGYGLFRKDKDGRIFPALASAVRRENSNRWRVTLRRDITFHDRFPITSADVKFTLELYKKFALQSPQLFKTRLISRVEVVDDKNLIIVLQQSLDDFQQSIGLLSILPKRHYGQWSEYNYISSLPEVTPVGCGYFLLRRVMPGEEIFLGSNQYHYYGAPKLSGIEIFFYQTYDQMIDAFLNEQIDIIPVEDGQIFSKVRQFTESINYVVAKRNDYKLFYINLNTKRAPFKDRNIRRALNYSINRNNFVEKDFVIRSRVADNILADKSEYSPPRTISYAYDPLNSLTILENSGYRKQPNGKLFQNNQEFKFTLLFEAGSQFQESLVRLISINLAEIGINSVPQPITAAEIEQKISDGDYQAALQTFLFGSDQSEEVLRQFYLEELNRPDGYKNYKTQELDRILRRLEGILPSQIAIPNWQRLQVLINRDTPCVFLLWQDHEVYFIHERFKQTTSRFEENFVSKFKINPKNEWIVQFERPE
jgi:peptide/nickel transport system substrate-binding protein